MIRRLIKFTFGNVMALITSIVLLIFFGSKISESPGAIILFFIVILTWLSYVSYSVVRLLKRG